MCSEKVCMSHVGSMYLGRIYISEGLIFYDIYVSCA